MSRRAERAPRSGAPRAGRPGPCLLPKSERCPAVHPAWCRRCRASQRRRRAGHARGARGADGPGRSDPVPRAARAAYAWTGRWHPSPTRRARIRSSPRRRRRRVVPAPRRLFARSRSDGGALSPLDVGRNPVDDLRPQRARQVVAHAVDDDELGVGDRGRGRPSARDVHERVVRRRGRRAWAARRRRAARCGRRRRGPPPAGGRRPPGRSRGRRRARHALAAPPRRARSPARRSRDTTSRSARSRPRESPPQARGRTCSASWLGAPTSALPVVDMIEVRRAHPLGVLDRDGLGDHPAHRGADQMGASQVERVEQADGVAGHVGQRVGRRRRVARTAAVQSPAAPRTGASRARRRGCRSARRSARARPGRRRTRPASRASAWRAP